MNRYLVCLAAGVLFATQAFAAGVEDIVPQLEQIAANPVIVKAVLAQNAKKVSLDEIKKHDDEWIAKKGNVPFAKENMENAAAKELAKWEKSKPYYVESILTDDQGANVAITSLTSDYWQGDEPKFQKAWADGKGATYIARPKQDESTGDMLSQVSVPVKSEGKVIGTLTVGIRVNKLQ